eukprot:Gregarina_sp_Poly_1__6434@NODE_343_length_9409_cov_658_993470_g287_i0_p1_GENE_NODE_343_length_9409_cov_658_993470_g287_i0NODE_343_length_9409_cov_658_993470_g287_i0_p1_ORF_typecomplete_len938_score118_98zfFCS/PF06467_14/8_9e03zfFCS/PF06467_14/0_017zfFCS/PF06467_14/4_2e03zfFCS/PF06467_14/5_3e02DZR/PF12773_7/5_5e02DZR/PF12773_7/1_3_NODE_343_length_9409_cov_658_993470_g287_i065959387
MEELESGAKSNRSQRRISTKKCDIAAPIHFGDAIQKLLKGKVTSDRASDEGISLDECALCAQQEIAYGAVGKCNHTELMCWICAIRLRLLAVREAQEPGAVEHHCPYDSELTPQVLLTPTLTNWESVPFSTFERHEPTGLYFSDKAVKEAFNVLQEIRCWFPDCFQQEVKFDSMTDLREHLLGEHNRKFCDICYTAKYPRLFLPEHVLYDPLDLVRHRRQGDNHIDPHVFCRACRKYLFDAEEMELHWRGSNDHFCCRLCRANGLQMIIFSSYDLLWEHHKANHFTCQHEECKQEEVVYANSNDLQLHMAKKHFESSEFYSNVGRRGVRVNLSALAEDASHKPRTHRGGKRRDRNTDSAAGRTEDSESSQPLTYTTDRVCALWPREMVGEADRILHYIDFLPQQYTSPAACSGFMTKLYNQQKRKFFPIDREWKQISSECEAMVRTNKPKPIDQALGTIARIVYGRWQWWAAKLSAHRMLEQPSPESLKRIDYKVQPAPELSAPVWLSTLGDISVSSEILIVLILAVPPELPEVQREMRSVISRVASYSAQARQDNARQTITPPISDNQPESPAMDGESPYESAKDTTPLERPTKVLANCGGLPINPNISFLEAIAFALDEFIRETDAENLLRDRSQWEGQLKHCPTKVPKNLLTRMRAVYRKHDFENFSHLERDLSPFISARILERFKALMPWYLLKRKEIGDRLIAKQNVSNRMSREQLQELMTGDNPTKWSQEWGAQCDTVFRELQPPQLILLRHYVEESKSMSPNACGIEEDLVSGIEREVLEQAPQITRTARTTYNTRTQTFEQSDFPELPQTAPGLPSPVNNAMGVWGRTVKDIRSSIDEGRNGSRRQPYSSSGKSANASARWNRPQTNRVDSWGAVECSHCGRVNTRAQVHCTGCNKSLHRHTSSMPAQDEFPGLHSFRKSGI